MGAWLWVVMALAQVGPTMPLYDAIRDGKVAISMRGTGASSGPGVVLELGKGPNAGPPHSRDRAAGGRSSGTMMRILVAPSTSSCEMMSPASIVSPNPLHPQGCTPRGIRSSANITASIWWGFVSMRSCR